MITISRATTSGSVVVIGRLPEDVIVNHDGGIGADHMPALVSLTNGQALCVGDAAHVRLGGLSGENVLVNVGRLNLDIDSSLAHQVGASRGRGGQNQAHRSLCCDSVHPLA